MLAMTSRHRGLLGKDCFGGGTPKSEQYPRRVRDPGSAASRSEKFAPSTKRATIIKERIMYENTEFSTSRDIEAIQIPAGTKITIPAGTPGVITQSLGGSYTIATNFG